MKEEEEEAKEAIKYILEFLSQGSSRTFAIQAWLPESTEIYASPEEGARLIHSFVRIKQPELRAAIIKIATQIAEH